MPEEVNGLQSIYNIYSICMKGKYENSSVSDQSSSPCIIYITHFSLFFNSSKVCVAHVVNVHFYWSLLSILIIYRVCGRLSFYTQHVSYLQLHLYNRQHTFRTTHTSNTVQIYFHFYLGGAGARPGIIPGALPDTAALGPNNIYNQRPRYIWHIARGALSQNIIKLVFSG